ITKRLQSKECVAFIKSSMCLTVYMNKLGGIPLIYNKDPRNIEESSFEIITAEMEKTFDDPITDAIVRRVIHTTADFEYQHLLKFHPEAIEKAIEALENGSGIYCDTQMISSGINKKSLNKLGGELYNFVHHQEIFKEAKERNITRSMVAIEKAMKQEYIKIFD